VQLDKIQASIGLLDRETKKTQRAVAELTEEVDHTRRFETFEESLRNSRDYKLKEIQRVVLDLKSRLDAIEGKKSTFVCLTYKTFESINKKLAELSALQVQVETSSRNVRRCCALFGAVLVFAIALFASHQFKRSEGPIVSSDTAVNRLPSSSSQSNDPAKRPISHYRIVEAAQSGHQ